MRVVNRKRIESKRGRWLLTLLTAWKKNRWGTSSWLTHIWHWIPQVNGKTIRKLKQVFLYLPGGMISLDLWTNKHLFSVCGTVVSVPCLCMRREAKIQSNVRNRTATPLQADAHTQIKHWEFASQVRRGVAFEYRIWHSVSCGSMAFGKRKVKIWMSSNRLRAGKQECEKLQREVDSI